ncbi:hypothetical protein SBRCBS47491_003433 [Sporothrix bragantina]|uniref:Uncharacterized protein n=1 Tax=Sporothrix bragantina TaxID=671064 RepID=A0ABP0BF75_9PEZI
MTHPQVAGHGQNLYGMRSSAAGQLQPGRVSEGLFQRGNYQDLPTQMRPQAPTPPWNAIPGRGVTPIDPSFFAQASTYAAGGSTLSSPIQRNIPGSNGNINRAGPSAAGRVSATAIQGHAISESESDLEAGSDSDNSDATIRGPNCTRRLKTRRGKGKKQKKDDNGDDVGGAGGSDTGGSSGASCADSTSGGNMGNVSTYKGKGRADDTAGNNANISQNNATISASDRSMEGSFADQNSHQKQKSIFSRGLDKWRNEGFDVADIIDRASEAVVKKKRDRTYRLAHFLYTKYLLVRKEAMTNCGDVPANTARDGLAAQQFIHAYNVREVREFRQSQAAADAHGIASPSTDSVERPPTPEVNGFDTAFSRILSRVANRAANQPVNQPTGPQVPEPPPSIVLTLAAETDESTNTAVPGLRPGVTDVAWSQGINLASNFTDTETVAKDTGNSDAADQDVVMEDAGPVDENE